MERERRGWGGGGGGGGGKARGGRREDNISFNIIMLIYIYIDRDILFAHCF